MTCLGRDGRSGSGRGRWREEGERGSEDVYPVCRLVEVGGIKIFVAIFVSLWVTLVEGPF